MAPAPHGSAAAEPHRMTGARSRGSDDVALEEAAARGMRCDGATAPARRIWRQTAPARPARKTVGRPRESGQARRPRPPASSLRISCPAKGLKAGVTQRYVGRHLLLQYAAAACG